MTFSDLNVPQIYSELLSKKGINNPSLIQELAFTLIQSGRSVVALSKTGTGKTLAYLLPLFLKAAEQNQDAAQKKLEHVVLVPTRELAHQVRDTLQFLSEIEIQKSVVVIGGEAEEAQVRAAKEARWIVATPGRLLDLAQRRLVALQDVRTLVFDEADRILDMGFIDDVRELLKFLPKPVPQMLFFSATLHFGIEELAYEFGVDFEKIGVEADEMTVEGLDHEVAFVGDDEKIHALCHFLFARKEARGIIFSNYRDRAHDLSHLLRRRGAAVEALSAQLSQGQRQKIMDSFRSGKVRILVASDLAARGLDVQDLDFVVNFDLPEDPATYVHRVGRTARAGKSGIALSMVGFNDSFRLEGLEKFLGHQIERFHFDPEVLRGDLPSWGPPVVSESGDRPSSRNRFERFDPIRTERPRPDRGRERSHSRAQGARGDFRSPPRSFPNEGRSRRAEAPRKEMAPIPRAVVPRPNVKIPPSWWNRMVTKILDLFGLEKATRPVKFAEGRASSPTKRHASRRPAHRSRRDSRK